jgi:hypothetical protein
MLVKVEGTEYYRDTKSMALVNKNSNEKNEYIMRSNLLKNQKQEINNIKEEINNIKGDMQEIKNLMLKLLEKGSNG